MIDYRKLYFTLFNTITDALEVPDFDRAKDILRSAQINAEEQYLSFDEEEAVQDCRGEKERLLDALTDYIDTCTEKTFDPARLEEVLAALDKADAYCQQQSASSKR